MPPVASSISWPLHLRPSGRRYVSKRASNFCAMCIGFMIPEGPPYNECYTASHQLQMLDTLGYQSTELQADRAFAVTHRREEVVVKIASFGEGSISRLFCLDVLELAPIGG